MKLRLWSQWQGLAQRPRVIVAHPSHVSGPPWGLKSGVAGWPQVASWRLLFFFFFFWGGVWGKGGGLRWVLAGQYWGVMGLPGCTGDHPGGEGVPVGVRGGGRGGGGGKGGGRDGGAAARAAEPRPEADMVTAEPSPQGTGARKKRQK